MKCANCNAPLNPGDLYCGECGQAVSGPAAPPPPPPGPPPVVPPPPIPPPVVPGIGANVLGCVILIGIAAGIFALGNYLQNLHKPGPRPGPTAVPTAIWSPSTPLPTPESTPSQIQAVWLDPDYVWKEGTYNLVIHCRFRVSFADISGADTQNHYVRVIARFWNSDGFAMKAQVPNFHGTLYATPEGQAATWWTLKLGYNQDLSADDFPLYMPVDALIRGRRHYGIVYIEDVGTNRVLDEARTKPFDVRNACAFHSNPYRRPKRLWASSATC